MKCFTILPDNFYVTEKLKRFLTIFVVILGGCGGTANRAVDTSWENIEESQIPVYFDPPVIMRFDNAEQRLVNRGQALATRIQYRGENQGYSAYFYMQDILAADRVYTDKVGSADDFTNTIKRWYGSEISEMGDSRTSLKLDYQHYLRADNTACVAFQKFSGFDGSGDVSGSSTARGSVMIIANFCEPGSEQIPSHQREKWNKSFKYRQL